MYFLSTPHHLRWFARVLFAVDSAAAGCTVHSKSRCEPPRRSFCYSRTARRLSTAKADASRHAVLFATAEQHDDCPQQKQMRAATPFFLLQQNSTTTVHSKSRCEPPRRSFCYSRTARRLSTAKADASRHRQQGVRSLRWFHCFCA